MARQLVELRILPPFVLGRLGSSKKPLDNYAYEYPDAVGYRKIVGAPTLIVDAATGTLSLKMDVFSGFRDAAGKIRPLCPFVELWVREVGATEFVPLTLELLSDCGLAEADVQWRVEVGNIKAFRRTGDVNDQVLADTGLFHDYEPKPLVGICKNFVEGASIPFGSVQATRPNAEFPEFRLRFTPADGRVFGPTSTTPDANVSGQVYDPSKGKWKGYSDATGTDLAARRVTIPGAVYANYPTDDGQKNISRGYLDDECDGFITAQVGELSAFARVAAGPPNFAPDSLPVRTIADELEQALEGPSFEQPASFDDLEEVRDIVRRALETVRLTNTTMMNAYSTQRGVGMARMDTADVGRAPEPIFDPTLVDPAAIHARHERVLLALESGTLTWFARALREFDQVGDLSAPGRHKMPAMMRGADGRYLALTRRQLNKVRATAEMIATLPGKA